MIKPITVGELIEELKELPNHNTIVFVDKKAYCVEKVIEEFEKEYNLKQE